MWHDICFWINLSHFLFKVVHYTNLFWLSDFIMWVSRSYSKIANNCFYTPCTCKVDMSTHCQRKVSLHTYSYPRTKCEKSNLKKAKSRKSTFTVGDPPWKASDFHCTLHLSCETWITLFIRNCNHCHCTFPSSGIVYIVTCPRLYW